MKGFDLSTISALYKGSTPCVAIYKGSTLIWSGETPPHPGEDYITLSTNSLNCGKNRDYRTFKITSNVAWTITQSEGSDSWLSVTPDKRTSTSEDPKTVRVNFGENTGDSRRYATLTISGGNATDKYVNISQEATAASVSMLRNWPMYPYTTSVEYSDTMTINASATPFSSNDLHFVHDIPNEEPGFMAPERYNVYARQGWTYKGYSYEDYHNNSTVRTNAIFSTNIPSFNTLYKYSETNKNLVKAFPFTGFCGWDSDWTVQESTSSTFDQVIEVGMPMELYWCANTPQGARFILRGYFKEEAGIKVTVLSGWKYHVFVGGNSIQESYYQDVSNIPRLGQYYMDKQGNMWNFENGNWVKINDAPRHSYSGWSVLQFDSIIDVGPTPGTVTEPLAIVYNLAGTKFYLKGYGYKGIISYQDSGWEFSGISDTEYNVENANEARTDKIFYETSSGHYWVYQSHELIDLGTDNPTV